MKNSIFKTLDEKEIILLFNSYHQGNIEAREKIIKHNIPLVYYLIKKNISYFVYTVYDFDDLLSIGMIGLIKAVDTFNEDFNYKFNTYAARCIMNEIYSYMRKEKKRRNDIYLDQTVYPNDETTLGDTICDVIDISEDLGIEDEYLQLHDIISHLKPREIELLRLFYKENISQAEISKMFHINQSTVSRQLAIVYEKIKQGFDNNYIRHESKRKSKIDFLYKFLRDYQVEDINASLSMLTQEEFDIIRKQIESNSDSLSNEMMSVVIPRICEIIDNKKSVQYRK